MVMADRTAGVKLPYRFLEEFRRVFIQEYGLDMPQRVVAMAYSDAFAPKMQYLMVSIGKAGRANLTAHCDCKRHETLLALYSSPWIAIHQPGALMGRQRQA